MEDWIQLFHLVNFDKNINQNYGCDAQDFIPINGKLSQNSHETSDDKVRNKCRNSQEITDTLPFNVCRRLIFTNENSANVRLLSGPSSLALSSPVIYVSQSHDVEEMKVSRSNKPVQLEIDGKHLGKCVRRRTKKYKLEDNSSLGNYHNNDTIKSEITGGIRKFNCDTISTKNSKILHSPAHVSPESCKKTFENKCTKVSTKEKMLNSSLTKPPPVHGAKTTNSYSNIQAWSSPFASNKKQNVGQQITVCVRKRPLSHAECKGGEVDVVTATDGQCVIVHESKESVDLTPYILQHKFYFDHVFGEESSIKEVYQKTAYPLVQHMFRGGNATCFAYGQTGAGKTHTMLGSCAVTPGLYTLAVQDIFAHLTTGHSYPPLLVYVSFFEIYCSQLYDLLDHRKRLFAREDGQKVVHISGLHEIRVDSANFLLEVVSKGTAQRTQGVSGVNPLSSRSHALLQIQLREPNQHTAGRMWFVDLAGSERASDAKERDKQRRMEGAEINQSLLALKECIRSLDKKASHTPFRQSRLTQVLKNSFVGDSMTCMIANISPGHSATEHTLNTLRYADRVKELKRKGDVMGKKGRKTTFSHEPNLIHSNCSTASTPVKTKLAKQSMPLCTNPPTTRFHAGGAPPHSTPKNNRYGEKAQSKEKQRVGNHRVRGWLGLGEIKHQYKSAVEEDGTTIKTKSTDKCLVRENSIRPVLVIRQQKEENQHVGETCTSCAAFPKCESGFHNRDKTESHLWTMQGRKEEEIQWIPPGMQWERSPEMSSVLKTSNERDLQRPDDEKKMHLRRYHQQLQQFVPSSVQFLSTSTCPSITFLTDSPYSSVLTQMQDDCEKTSDGHSASVKHEACTNPTGRDGVDGRCGSNENWGEALERINKEQYIFEREIRRSTGSTQEARVRKEDSRIAGMEEEDQRWVWEAAANRDLAKAGAIPTSKETQQFYHCDSEERRKVGVERLHGLCVPQSAVWINRHRWTSACSEALHSRDNSNCQFDSSFERTESKLFGHNASSHILELENNVQVAPLGHDREKKLCLESLKSRKCSHNRSTTKEEQKESKTQINKTMMSENLDFSLNLNCPKTEDNTKKTVVKGFSHADVDEILEYKGKEIILEPPQRKTFHPTNSDTVTAANQTQEQSDTQRNACGMGLNKPQPPGFRLASFQHKNNSVKKVIETSASDTSVIACLQKPVESPRMHAFPLETLNQAEWCVAEAHMELLKGMGKLGLKEEHLLSHQSDMAFGEFVNKLEEIMERKVNCIQSMRAQLQPYLKESHPQ
uniref:Kinesin motor domain-containing protein n=1 Tax=Oryzias latipes TaxID=8090 RepID=A0A3P9IZF2_ORYLA